MEKNEMGWACGAYGCGEGGVKGLGGETGGKETTGGDLGIDGWIILGCICGMWVYGLDWAGPG